MLLICVLADIIHFAKIIVTFNLFFSYPKRESVNKRLMTIFAVLAVASMSAGIYTLDSEIVETFIYVIVTILLTILLYKEKVFNTVVVTMWILFALSMIDTMTFILFDISMELFGIDGKHVSRLVVAIITLFLIYFMGNIYRKNASSTLEKIGVTNLVGFTILLAVDTLVVNIIAVMNSQLNFMKYKNIYLLAVVFVIIGIFIQLASVILLFTQRNVYKEKEEITDRYLNEQKNHYEYLENREKETKKFRHDLRSHMEMISNLAKNNEYEEIDAYLEQMHIKIDSFGNMVTVQNGIVDAIINQYYMKAMQSGVKMEVKGRFPVDCSIDAFDLCTIFSNVLSNALEAAAETEEKYISLECGYTDKNIIIVVENSFCEDAKSGNSLWTTRKANKDYHGYGLENINDSVNKYDGVFDIEPKGNRFILKILFHNVGK